MYQRRARPLPIVTMHKLERPGDGACAGAPAPGSLCRSILVGLGPYRRDSQTLAVASALARREGARLTVLAAVNQPPALAWASPLLMSYDPARVAEDECVVRLRAAIADLPADLSVTTLLRHRPAVNALLAELRSEAHDLVVVGGGRRHWTRWFARRIARILPARSNVPVLVVNSVRPAERVPVGRTRDLAAQGA
jgi:nucleotide-binding universal stress UspA family protein